MKTKKKTKRLTPWDDGYYEKVERPGKPSDWKAAFNERMGWQEAVETVGHNDPYEILGISNTASKAEIRKAFRALIMRWHPDKWMNSSPASQRQAAEKAKKIIAAYTVLIKGSRNGELV